MHAVLVWLSNGHPTKRRRIWVLLSCAHAHLAKIMGWRGIKTLLQLLVKLLGPAGGFWRPYLTYIGISLMYATVAGGLVSFVEPLAAGSGIAEVKTYLNGVHIRGLLAVRLLRGHSSSLWLSHKCMARSS